MAVVAAGERWAGGGLRPAVEDAWGAGAVIDHLTRAGWAGLSPEAVGARAAWRAAAGDIRNGLLSCASGQELIGAGYRGDVDIAAEVGTSRCVPVLRGDVFLDRP